MSKECYYPVFLDLRNVPCVVIGGGIVAQRKVEGLCTAGAHVTVVSPELVPALSRLHIRNRITWIPRLYRSSDLKGKFLAIAATDNAAVNNRVYRDADKRHIAVNVVDDPAHCRFIVPAVARTGDIVVAVSTGGGAPGVSARIRDEIHSRITAPYEPLVVALKARRARVKKLPIEQRRVFWKQVAALSKPALARADVAAKLDAWLERVEKKNV